MKKTVTILALCLTANCALAQSLTLERCKELAIENNKTLKQRSIDMEISEQQRKEAFTHLFPEVSGSVTSFKGNRGLVYEENIALPAIEGLPSAIDIELLSKGTIATVSAMQPIYAGGQVRSSNQLAKIGEEVSKIQYQLSEEEVQLKSEQYYWSCIELEEKLTTLLLAIKQVEATHKQVQDFVDAGIITQNDLLVVNLKLNELRRNELQLNNGIELSKLMLAQFIGLPDEVLTLEKPMSWSEQNPYSYMVSAYDAVQQSKELSLLEKGVAAKTLEKRLSIGGQMPTLAIGGAYLYNDLTGSSNNGVYGMLSLSVPISKWWGGSHRIKQAKLKLSQSELQRDELTEQMELRVKHTFNTLIENFEQIKLARESIAQAQENLRMFTEQYEAGTVQITDLMGAQTLLQHSRNAETEALIAYQIAMSHYLQRTNRYM